MPNTIPVLIIGAGPTGLTMAAELNRHGIECRIIDKENKPVTTSNALGVHSRTLEVFEDMGIIDEALKRGIKINKFSVYADGKRITQADFRLLDSPYPFVLGLAQSETEKILINHLAKHDIEIESPVEILNFDQQNHSVIVHLKDTNNKTEELKAEWLIACDGAHSFVRKKLNIPFIGKKLEEHFIMADTKVDWEINDDEAAVFLSPQGAFATLTFKPSTRRLIVEVTNDPELAKCMHPTKENFERLAKERVTMPIKFDEPTWTSGFWINERIVPEYRHKHVFLAGDAAHIHSPVGGQGMNTGIQDAYNLAWKLALVIKGASNESLLDSYNIERRPVAHDVLKASTMMTHIIATRNRFLKAIRNFFFKLINKSNKFRERFLTIMSEHAINYRKSPITKNLNDRSAKIKSGDLAPDCKNLNFQGETKRFYKIINGTQHNLIVFCNPNADDMEISHLKNSVNNIAQKYNQLLQTIFVCNESIQNKLAHNTLVILDNTNQLAAKFGINQSSLYLIRPDQYVGFCCSADGAIQLQPYLQEYIFNY